MSAEAEDAREDPLPAVPDPRPLETSHRSTLLTLGILGLVPPLAFLAPAVLVLAQSEIRALRRKGREPHAGLEAARALGALGTTLLAIWIVCCGGFLWRWSL